MTKGDVVQTAGQCGVDALCASTIVATFAGLLPTILASIATLCAIIWYGLQIYDRFWPQKVKCDDRDNFPSNH